MCYVLLLSTSSSEDLSVQNNDLVRFSRDVPAIADANLLRNSHRWYIGSQSGCSCTFRHLHSPELGFSEPVDWYPEEPEDIQATLQLVGTIRRLLVEGHKVDVIDAWEHKGMKPALHGEMQVDLSQVSDERFRFIENYHFIFGQQSNNSLERTREG